MSESITYHNTNVRIYFYFIFKRLFYKIRYHDSVDFVHKFPLYEFTFFIRKLFRIIIYVPSKITVFAFLIQKPFKRIEKSVLFGGLG